MKDYLITYVWRGEFEVEAESEEDAMEQMHEELGGCQGDPRGLFSLDDESFEVEEALQCRNVLTRSAHGYTVATIQLVQDTMSKSHENAVSS